MPFDDLLKAIQEWIPKTLARAYGQVKPRRKGADKTTIYCANIAAGLMLAEFTKYLRGLPVDSDIRFNLLANELAIAAS